MPCREYDEKQDSWYEPNVAEGLYLSPRRVRKALTAIQCTGEEYEEDVRNIIQEIEEINRDEKLRRISSEDSVKLNSDIEDRFRDKYGIWPYQTKTYKLFYQQFGTME